MTALHILFKVGNGDYVLPAADVLQMESFTSATQVPGAASYVAGLVQIRGKVIPVIDLRARFGLPAIARTLDSRVVVVQSGERQVGLLADSAREVLRLDADAFRPPPEVVAAQSSGFVDSVAQAGSRIVMRIDFEKVIGQDALGKVGAPPETGSKEKDHGQQA
jgi:purine-binding chemotaxis protein CheW